MNLPYQKAEEILSRMTVEQKLGQMIMASIEVTEMDDATRTFLRNNHVGNIILFGKNCQNRAQLATLTRQIQQEVTDYSSGVQALLSIDQEGGNVTRIRNGATVFSCAAAVGSTGDPDMAYLTGHMMGNELRALGIAFNLAPVLDTNGVHTGILPTRRSYGATAAQTARFGGAYARGLRDTGVLDCGKHFPGAGDSIVDTHFDTSVVCTPAEELREKSIGPFRQAIKEGMSAIMITHDCFPALDPACVPASVSKPILQDLLREELGFEGLTISDGMQMLAIADVYGAPRGCVLAAQAGCDFVIVGTGGDNADPNGANIQIDCIQSMLQAVKTGELPMERVDESARRIIAFKLMLGDMTPAPDVLSRDWSAHAAFSAALAGMAATVIRDETGLLPLPDGALFLSRTSKTRLGVEEGDQLIDGFAPMAARLCHGEAVEFEQRPDLKVLKDKLQSAAAVVLAVANGKEAQELLEDARSIAQLNSSFCFVALDMPEVARLAEFAPCVIAGYDQTVNAIRAVCKRLKK